MCLRLFAVVATNDVCFGFTFIFELAKVCCPALCAGWLVAFKTTHPYGEMSQTEPLTQALVDSIAKENYRKAITHCDKKLSVKPDDKAVLKTKCLCLIETGQYQEALTFLEAQSKELQQELISERAYSLYKLRRHDEALKLIESMSKPGTAQIHLKGQTYYRMGQFDNAIEVFQNLQKQDKSSELLVNIAAAKCMNKSVPENLPTEHLSHELLFNNACALLHQGKLEEAEKQLHQAEELCRKSMTEEEYGESEIVDELSFIQAQLAYLYQITGRDAMAIEIYETILKNKPSDSSVMAVASNNLVCLHKDHKLFYAEKHLFTAISASEDHKLTKEQEKIINFNRAVVYLKMGKMDKCHEVVEKLVKEYPESPLPSLIHAAALLKEKKNDDARNMLKKNSEQGDITSKIALAQLLLKDGKIEESLASLSDLGDHTQRLGVVATRIQLCEQLKRPDEAKTILKDAVSHWSKSDNKEMYKQVLKAGSEYLMSKSDYEGAASLLKTLIQTDKTHQNLYLPSLVIALSYYDSKEASTYAENLPEIVSSGESVDVEKLENVSSYRPARENSKTTEQGEENQLEERKKTKKKKKKIRLPKNYNPNEVPDPERWLPQKQRSTYKKKKGGKKSRAHQGSTMAEPIKASANTTANTADTTSKPTAPKNNKKKKKGKKKAIR